MKISRLMAVTALAACLVTTTTFAAADTTTQNGGTKEKRSASREFKGFGGRGMGGGIYKEGMRGPGGFFGQNQDPSKMFESRKEHIQAMLKAGKITQAEAGEQTARIDEEIKKIDEFNALTLDQKKEKLTSEFKTKLDKEVADGKLTQAKADEMLKGFTDKLANWDGKGHPGFGMPGGPGKGEFKGPRGGGAQDPLKMLESRKEHIQAMLKDGKITQSEADTQTAKIDEEIKKINEFNALTLDQKKEKLTGEFKTKLDKEVAGGKLTQAKADEMLKGFTDKLANWDGTGYPGFGMRGGHGKGGFICIELT